MKKIALLLVFSLIACMLCGCTEKQMQPPETAEETSSAPAQQEQQPEQPEENNEGPQEQELSTEEADADEKTSDNSDAEEETANAEEQTVSEQGRPLIDAVSGLYRYSNGEAYICILDNHTYAKYDFERNTDGIVRFWSRQDNNNLVLYDENGAVADTLYAEETDDRVTVKNGSEMVLKPFDHVMNGTYDCLISAISYSKSMLLVMQELPFWVSDEDAAALEVGSTLNNTDLSYFGISVESLEKKSDSLYLINDEMELTRDDEAGAWKLSTGFTMLQQIGRCTVDEKTLIKDIAHNGEHVTLDDCLRASDSVEARITVKDGRATELEILSVF